MNESFQAEQREVGVTERGGGETCERVCVLRDQRTGWTCPCQYVCWPLQQRRDGVIRVGTKAGEGVEWRVAGWRWL